MGLGRELYGGWVKTPCNWMANSLKTDLEYRSGWVFKGFGGTGK